MQSCGTNDESRLLIVLAHPRTGSSLLMQTLRLLGTKVVGSRMREDLPAEANPRGYFEEKDILTHGMTESAVRTIESTSGDRVAVKVALVGALKPGCLQSWRYWQERHATILVPVRHPLETALSRTVFSSMDNLESRSKAQFLFVTRFLWLYRQHFRDLATILVKEVPALLPHVHVVSHARACSEPERYVEQVAAMAGIVPTGEQKEDALANIDPSLYRYRLNDFSQVYRTWDVQIGASWIYDLLLNEVQPWTRIYTKLSEQVAES